VAVRDRRPASLTPWRPSAQSRHPGRGSGLINEHQPVGIEIELALEPEPPRNQQVFALLFGRVCGLFLNVMARFLKKCQTVEGTARTPCSPANCSAIS
jgi:hypothetical protein